MGLKIFTTHLEIRLLSLLIKEHMILGLNHLMSHNIQNIQTRRAMAINYRGDKKDTRMSTVM